MSEERTQPFIDYARHREEWLARRAELKGKNEPAQFTVRATVEVLQDFFI